MIGSRRALHVIERNLLVYKHGWLVLLSGFFEPLFYLLSIGFGWPSPGWWSRSAWSAAGDGTGFFAMIGSFGQRG